MNDEDQIGMTVRLSPAVTAAVQELATEFCCDPIELVRIGIGMVGVIRQAREERLKVAVVTDSGIPVREVMIPELRSFQQPSINDTVQRMIEEVQPSSLQRAIADLDPDCPKNKSLDGPIELRLKL